MTSKTVTQLLADLGVLQSHSRLHQSSDNPYSAANFKTLKYFPTFPKRFVSIGHARDFVDGFFSYYNNEHPIPASRCTRPPTGGPRGGLRVAPRAIPQAAERAADSLGSMDQSTRGDATGRRRDVSHRCLTTADTFRFHSGCHTRV